MAGSSTKWGRHLPQMPHPGSTIVSHLNYALPAAVWGTSRTQQNFSRIQHIQNRAIRLLYHLNKCDHITSYYNQLQWLKFEQLVKFCTTCIMFHYFHSTRGIQLNPPCQSHLIPSQFYSRILSPSGLQLVEFNARCS